MRIDIRRLPFVIAAGLIATAAVGASVIAASPNLKFALDPWGGLADSDRQAQVQSAYEQQANFIRDFNASGQDPRSIHHEASQSFYAGPESLKDSLGASDVVVLATVRTTTFEPVAGQWLGQARVTVEVLRTLKGQAGATFELLQPGSPAPTADGHGVLQELDVMPVLLPDDRVILSLIRTTSGVLTPLAGTGIVYVEAGRVRTVERSSLQATLSGVTEEEILSLYAAELAADL